MGELKQEKILIFISSVMVWSDTQPKIKKEGDDPDEEPEEADSDPEPEVEEEQKDAEMDEPAVKIEYLKFTEADYTRRKPLPQYEAIKALETLCISAGNSKDKLKSFVLCAGIQYGMGEQVFYDHVKKAWLQQPLNFYGKGRNRVPCIHVKDLATFVQKVAERPPALNYIFAIDHNGKPNQKKLIKAISDGIGNCQIQQVDDSQDEFVDVLTIDLRMKPTKAFDAFIEEAANQEDNVEEGQDPPPKYTFNWWCKEGIQKNIFKINEEFNKALGLDPIKVFVTGPPAVGKTYWSKQIASYFSIPHLSIKDVIDQYLKLQNEDVEALRSALEEQRATMIEEAQNLYEIEKKKRKALGQQYVAFDENSIQARLTDEQLYQVMRWRLQQNDCQNRGYVLDGFPKSYEHAYKLFMMPEKGGEDGDDAENRPMVLNVKIGPQHVIRLNGDDESLITRVQGLREDELKGTHWNERDMQRRLKAYRQLNLEGTGFPMMVDFFREQMIDVVEIDCFNSQNKIFNICRSFIEREENMEKQRLLKQQQQKEEVLKRSKEQQEIRDAKEAQLWKQQEEEYRIKQEHSRNYERELLDTRSQPLRQYLNDNVVPFITEGLIEIVRNSPKDPVDFLAQFMFKRSLQVEFADPGKYFDKLQQPQQN